MLEVIPENIRPQIDVMFKRVWQTYDKKVQKTPLGLLSNVEKLKKMNFGYNYETDFSFIGGCLCYADRNNYVNLNLTVRPIDVLPKIIIRVTHWVI